MKPSSQDIQKDIIGIVTTMIEDWDLDVDDLGLETKFNEDLCVSSVDMLNLMASIDMKYKKKLPYESLIVKDGQYVKELSVGDLATFVFEKFDVPSSEPEAM